MTKHTIDPDDPDPIDITEFNDDDEWEDDDELDADECGAEGEGNCSKAFSYFCNFVCPAGPQMRADT